MSDFKDFRKANHLTQEQASTYFKCTQGFISQIEKGIRPIPAEFISKAVANKKWDTSMLMNSENPEKVEPVIPSNSESIDLFDMLAIIRQHGAELIQHGEELRKQGARLDRMLDLVSGLDKASIGASSRSKLRNSPPLGAM